MDVRDFDYGIVDITDYRGTSLGYMPQRKWELRNRDGVPCAIIFDARLAEKLGAKPLVKATA